MRKLATAAAVSLILSSGSARALILGEIEMRSALNQPMSAEIALTSVADGELTGMIVKLASEEAFARAGIDRSAVLSDLRFSVTEGSGGQPVISITSTRPVLEPFLNFLLEVDWTRGRMVREYTVLLDPPVFMSPNASTPSGSSESPVIAQNSAGDSSLVPVEIDRSTGVEVSLDEVFDESSVVVANEVVEVGDELVVSDLGVSSSSSGAGEIVSLDNIDFGTEVGTTIDTGVATLSDPQVVSLDDIAVSDASSFNAETGWDVQVVGGTGEVSDEVGGELVDSTVAFSSNNASLGGEIVSLDNLSSGSNTASSGASQVTVNRNDTLWEIANRNKIAGMSTQQMMLALLDANEQAFINGNINLVKAGAILRIPDANEVARLSQNEAVAQVQTQEKLWREYRDNLRGARAPTTVAENSVAEPAEQTDAAADSDATSTAEADTDALATQEEQLATSADEILNQARNELRIVADNDSTSSAASATADETESSDAAQLGGVNQKLQLAREELSATRLEGEELVDKNQELEALTENMDQLVSLQQDQLAQLQAQLAAAREKDAAATAAGVVEDAAGSAADTMTATADGAVDTATAAVNNLQDNAAQVELIPDNTTANNAVTTTAAADPTVTNVGQIEPQASGPWYQSFLSDPRKAILAGLGALGALLLGWLLLRKRKGKDELDEEFLDQVQFVEDEDEFGPVADAQPAANTADSDSSMAKVAGGAAAVAGAAGVMAASDDNQTDLDETVHLGAELDSESATADETLSKDDTVSEAEVYLAYGLHGQAEDLLTKAIEKNPDNAEYRLKLLQTYHAQGKSEAFDSAAAHYHSTFGGDASPSWDKVAEMGKEVSSSDLYVGDGSPVENVGAGTLGAPTLMDNDFASEGESGAQSQIREFSSDTEEVSDITEDESALLDQSLDPGFAFDESDLEATGDFTQLSEEMKHEEAANEDGPGIMSDLTEKLSDTGASIGDGAKGAAAGLAAGAAGLAGAVGLGGSKDDQAAEEQSTSLEDGIIEFSPGDMTETVSDATDDITESFSAKAEDLTDAGNAQADALTMDLEELTDNLSVDETLESGLDLTQDLEIPDLTSSIDLTADASAALGNVDEMDTMMDLAKAYIDMGDTDSASSALGEIVKSGNSEQKTEAENLLKKIS